MYPTALRSANEGSVTEGDTEAGAKFSEKLLDFPWFVRGTAEG